MTTVRIAAVVSRGLLAAGLLGALMLPMRADAQRLAPAAVGAPAVAGAPPAARGEKSRLVAFGLGYLFPGAGHFYAGESWRGATIMGVVYGSIMFMMSEPESSTAIDAAGVVALGTYLWSMIDAPMAANRQNRRARAQAAANP